MCETRRLFSSNDWRQLATEYGLKYIRGFSEHSASGIFPDYPDSVRWHHNTALAISDGVEHIQ